MKRNNLSGIAKSVVYNKQIGPSGLDFEKDLFYLTTLTKLL